MSVGFEFETDKMIIIKKNSQTVYNIPLQQRKVYDQTTEGLRIKTDAPVIYKKNTPQAYQIKEILENYIKLRGIYNTRNAHIYNIQSTTQKLDFNNTEFDFLSPTYCNVSIHTIIECCNQKFSEALHHINQYMQLFTIYDTYLSAFDKNSKSKMLHQIVPKQHNINAIMISPSQKISFLLKSKSNIRFTTQMTIGCPLEYIIIAMMQFSKLCPLSFTGNDIFQMCCIFISQIYTKNLEIYTSLVIFLYNFATRKYRSKCIFFIRNWTFDIYNFLDENQQRDFIVLINSPKCRDFIINQLGETIENYIHFQKWLSRRQQQIQGQFMNQLRYHHSGGAWKTMFSVSDKIVFFEFRGLFKIIKSVEFNPIHIGTSINCISASNYIPTLEQPKISQQKSSIKRNRSYQQQQKSSIKRSRSY
jgi:hypothetical protein